MSTIPSYPAAALPLSGTDQFYLEQGSDADRGKRATIQNVIDKVQSSMEYRIAGIEGDVSILEDTTATHTSDITILKTVLQERNGTLNGFAPNGSGYVVEIGSLTLPAGKWALSGFTYVKNSANSGNIPANTVCQLASHINTTGSGTQDLANFPNVAVDWLITSSSSIAGGSFSTTNGTFIYDVESPTTVYLIAVVVSPGTAIKWDAYGALVAKRIF